MISLSAPSIYSVYPGGFSGYPSPTSPTTSCSPTPAFGFPGAVQPLGMPTTCFPPFSARPPQPYGMMPPASFPHRNTLSAKNLQAFNAYQTHLYPDIYTDLRQGGPGSKSSSGVSSPTFPSGSISPCDFPFHPQTGGLLHDLSGKMSTLAMESELQSRMPPQLGDAASWDRERRADYEEKQLLALNGKATISTCPSNALPFNPHCFYSNETSTEPRPGSRADSRVVRLRL